MRDRGVWRLIGLGFPAAALVAAVVGSAGAAVRSSAGQIDIRGVWDAPSHVGATAYPQQWHVTQENFTTGAFSGIDTSGAGNFTIVGSLSGSHFVVTVSQAGYVSHGQGTISGGSGDGTFLDSNGTRGTFTLKRLSGPPSSTTTPSTTTPTTPGTNPDQSQVCAGDCASGLNETYDPALTAGQTTDTTSASCGSGRSTAAVESIRGFGICSAVQDIAAAAGDITQPALSTSMQQALSQTLQQLGQSLSDPATATSLQNALQQMNLQSTLQETNSSLQQQQQQIQEMLQNVIDNLQSNSSLQSTDSALAGDFPAGDDRSTASARAGASSGAQLASPALVYQSIVSEHPSAAASSAFRAAVKAATAKTFSKARAQARLTLAVAALVGRVALARDIAHLGSTITLATISATLKPHTKRSLPLVATPLGARILRYLGVVGLKHTVTVQLSLSSTQNGKTSRATRTIRVR